jgi:hypothetical protein
MEFYLLISVCHVFVQCTFIRTSAIKPLILIDRSSSYIYYTGGGGMYQERIQKPAVGVDAEQKSAICVCT